MYFSIVDLFYQPGWGVIRVKTRDEIPYDPREGNSTYWKLETDFLQVKNCVPQTIAIIDAAHSSFVGRNYPMAYTFLQDMGLM